VLLACLCLRRPRRLRHLRRLAETASTAPRTRTRLPVPTAMSWPPAAGPAAPVEPDSREQAVRSQLHDACVMGGRRV
jgi:hypothetical protein